MKNKSSRIKLFLNLSILAGLAFSYASQALLAADLTLVSGFYEKSSQKIEGKTRGSDSLVSLSGRYSDDLTTETAWLGEGAVRMRSYTSSNGAPTPDNSIGLTMGSGIRYYFAPFVPSVVPYATGIAKISNDKSVQWTSDGYVQTSTSGLYYGANAGIRAGLGGDFFVELEIPFFENPLFAATKVETVTQAGAVTTTKKEESTETSLYVSSVGRIYDARIGVGMKL